MTGILNQIPEKIRSKAYSEKQPEWTDPMLAKLNTKRFSDPDWIYERKLDGERCLIFKRENTVQLMSRNRKQLNDIYPELVDPLKEQYYSFICDGEIVTFENGVTSFSKLQQRMHNKENLSQNKINVKIYIFDLLHIDGINITRIPLRNRKKILKKCISFSQDELMFCTHINEQGEAFYKDACKKGWEGVIAKDATAAYVHSRSRKWLKFKCSNRQEMVIAGFTDPQGSRKGFGALLIGYYKNKKLQYAGKVGTGYSDKLLKDMRLKMDELEIGDNPFEQKDIGKKNVHWIKPTMVGEFKFTEWTDDNRLRHPRFLGLRYDKEAAEVTREKDN